ncbi:MAG: hypothetical protein NT154_47485, partial [Verrucomicrobia bacterium]|nr:hypothetical protein [Verrucomicrobiota bacterium]
PRSPGVETVFWNRAVLATEPRLKWCPPPQLLAFLDALRSVLSGVVVPDRLAWNHSVRCLAKFSK